MFFLYFCKLETKKLTIMKKITFFTVAAMLLMVLAGCTKANFVKTWAGNGVLRPNAEDPWDSYMAYMTLHDDGTVTRFLTSVDDAFKPQKAKQIEGVGSWESDGKHVTITLDPTWARFTWERLTTEYVLDNVSLYLANGSISSGEGGAVSSPSSGSSTYAWMESSYSM